MRLVARAPRSAAIAPLLILGLLILGLLAVIPQAGATGPAGDGKDPGLGLTMVSQTDFVEQGGLFELVLDTSSVPADARVELVVRDRVLSRSEFGLSVTGDRLRSIRFSTEPGPFAAIPGFDLGRASFAIRLGSEPGQARLTREGVYPVEVRIFDGQGARTGELVTHLILLPDPSEESRPIAVALVSELGLEPALAPDGELRPPDASTDDLARTIEVLANHPDVPLTISVRPETVDRLAATDDPDSAAALAALREAVPGRQVLALPHLDVDVAAMLAAGLDAELDTQLALGERALTESLGVVPDPSVWLAEPSFDLAAAEALRERGRNTFVVDEGRVGPVDATQGLSLTQTFGLPLPGPSPTAAKADPVLGFRLLDRTDPVRSAHTVLAELGVLSLEQPTASRGLVIRPREGTGPPIETLDIVLGALATPNALMTPVTLDQFFGQVDALDGVEPELTPAPRADLSGYARDLTETRRLLASYATMTGELDTGTTPFDQLLLTAAARSLTPAERREYVSAARDAVTGRLRAVTISDARTVTLTDREGSVPLTLRNESGTPLRVVVRLDSERLDFPGGDALELTLTDEITRVDVEVNTRASGSFPLRIEVGSPDGALELASTRVTIRATAVSGVGIVLSVGALVVLLLWWVRDWRSGRRDGRLVERRSSRPAH